MIITVVFVSVPMRGFCNNDNTCYMNAFLQVLLNCNSFLQLVPTIGNSFCLSLREIITKYHESFQPLNIDTFKNLLFLTCKNNFNPSLQNGQQQDCHEFFIYFCNVFANFSGPTVFQSCVSVFEFSSLQIVTCKHCGASSTSSTTSYVLDVTVKSFPNSENDIATLIEADRLEKNVHRTCTFCNSTEADIATQFETFPKCLVICLKRFMYERLTQSINIDRTSVKYSRQLYIGEGYRLLGVVHHQGSQESGHYWTEIFNGSDVFELNDVNVRNTFERFDTSSSYILFYEKNTLPQKPIVKDHNSLSTSENQATLRKPGLPVALSDQKQLSQDFIQNMKTPSDLELLSETHISFSTVITTLCLAEMKRVDRLTTLDLKNASYNSTNSRYSIEKKHDLGERIVCFLSDFQFELSLQDLEFDNLHQILSLNENLKPTYKNFQRMIFVSDNFFLIISTWSSIFVITPIQTKFPSGSVQRFPTTETTTSTTIADFFALHDFNVETAKAWDLFTLVKPNTQFNKKFLESFKNHPAKRIHQKVVRNKEQKNYYLAHSQERNDYQKTRYSFCKESLNEYQKKGMKSRKYHLMITRKNDIKHANNL